MPPVEATSAIDEQVFDQHVPAAVEGHNVPVVNVVATFVMIVSIPLAWLAQKLGDSDG